MEKSGYYRGIYQSLRPPLPFPKDEYLSMVSFVFKESSSYPERLALADAHSVRSINFAQLKILVQKASHGLIKLGIQKGDTVLLFAPNSIEFPVCFLAVIAAGAIATTANTSYTTREITDQVRDSGAKLVITVPALWENLRALGLPAVIIGCKSDHAVLSDTTITYFPDLLELGNSVSWFPNIPIRQMDTAAILYSSGTTGTSKGVVLTHQAFISVSLMVTQDQDLDQEGTNVYICFLPMFHIFGLCVITYSQLRRGNSVVVMARFELELLLSSIERYRVTHLLVAPPVMIALAKQNWGAKYDLSSLKRIGSGAAPLGKDVMLECAKNFPQAVIVQGYGLTESCGIVSLENPMGGVRSYGSTGTLVAGVESKIVSTNNLVPLPPNELGELWIRGPNMMKGYLNNKGATESTIDEQGWVQTGDLGLFDNEGRLFIVDRIKELIKYKGFQIAPAELEGLLLTHPHILDAAVTPLPDAETGEVPIAYVVRLPNSHLTAQDVQKFIAGQVAPFKRLRGVIFVDIIPKSPSGKILRRELIKNIKAKL